MPLTHQFGILDNFNKERKYIEYEPRKYHCVTVDDDILSSVMDELSIMKTYFHSYHRPEFGLAYYGITIIPPESLTLFHNVVASTRLVDLNDLASIIIKAIEEKKHIIHFGI